MSSALPCYTQYTCSPRRLMPTEGVGLKTNQRISSFKTTSRNSNSDKGNYDNNDMDE